MKRLLKQFISMIFLLSPMCMSATSPYTLMLSRVIMSEAPDEIKETPRRNRVPASPIDCVISSEGIFVVDSSVNLAEAVSYEIWDAESEWCVASYSDEFSFIESLFTMSGEFQIRLVFTDYELVGNVEI